MNKIIFNGGPWNWSKKLGVHRYLSSILLEMDRMVNPGEVEFVVTKGNEKYFSFKNIRVITLNAPNNPVFQKLIWSQVIFPFYVRKNDGLGVDAILALPMWGCDAFVIYDCIRELHPQKYADLSRRLSDYYYCIRARICMCHAKEIFTDSNDAKKDILSLYHRKSEKVHVIYSGWQHFNEIMEDAAVLDRLRLRDQRYFFSVGSQQPLKNFKWVVEAAKQNPAYFFVVAGYTLLPAERNYSDQPSNIVFTGYLEDGEVKALMRNCVAFIQPSFCEGFGLPPLEAMSVGARCIVSNTTSLPEIYRNSVWYIDPYQYDNIDMDQIMSTEIVQNEEVLQLYSWEKSARKMLDILKLIQ